MGKIASVLLKLFINRNKKNAKPLTTLADERNYIFKCIFKHTINDSRGVDKYNYTMMLY